MTDKPTQVLCKYIIFTYIAIKYRRLCNICIIRYRLQKGILILIEIPIKNIYFIFQMLLYEYRIAIVSNTNNSDTLLYFTLSLYIHYTLRQKKMCKRFQSMFNNRL